MILVFAGNHKQFVLYTKQAPKGKYKYVSELKDVLGHTGFKYVKIGTYYAKENSWIIEDELELRGTEL